MQLKKAKWTASPNSPDHRAVGGAVADVVIIVGPLQAARAALVRADELQADVGHAQARLCDEARSNRADQPRIFSRLAQVTASADYRRKQCSPIALACLQCQAGFHPLARVFGP